MVITIVRHLFHPSQKMPSEPNAMGALKPVWKRLREKFTSVIYLRSCNWPNAPRLWLSHARATFTGVRQMVLIIKWLHGTYISPVIRLQNVTHNTRTTLAVQLYYIIVYSVVGRVTTLPAGRYGVRFPRKTRKFLLLQNLQARSATNPTSYSMGIGDPPRR
jgi:hypothetical protein